MRHLVDIIVSASRPAGPIPTGIEPVLPRLADVKAVLFDVYGTLFVSGSGDIGVASEAGSGKALARACADSAGIQLAPGAGERGVAILRETILAEHEQLRACGADYPEVDIREIWATVTARLLDEGFLSRAVPHERVPEVALRYELAVNPVWPMPGARAVLGQLRSAGFALGIVSNAQFYTPLLFPALLDNRLQALGFRDDLCTWSYVVRRGKPSEHLYQAAEEGLATAGFSAAQTLFVGNDMLNDMTAPAKHGWKTALFAGDKRSLRLREEDGRCLGVQPDAIITDLGQISSIIQA